MATTPHTDQQGKQHPKPQLRPQGVSAKHERIIREVVRRRKGLLDRLAKH